MTSSETMRLAKRIAQTIGTDSAVAYTVSAQVVQSDSGGTYVMYDGAKEPTPVDVGMSVRPGDRVSVRVQGGRAVVTDNLTRPATDDRMAGEAAKLAQTASDTATAAEAVALEAQAVAEATGQHFWDDDDGAHVTDVTAEEWAAAADAGFIDQTDAKPYHNALWNSLGMLFRRGLLNLVSISRSAIAFFDGTGNQSANVVASFGASGAQIGKLSSTHITIDSDSMDVVDGSGAVSATFGADGFTVGEAGKNQLVGDWRSLTMRDKEHYTFFDVSDLRESSGYAELVEEFEGDGASAAFALNFTPRSKATTSATVDGAAVSVSSVSGATVTLASAPAEGAAVAIAFQAASRYAKSYTLGVRDPNGPRLGGMSMAEGAENVAAGNYSHVEGRGSQALSAYGHAEGRSAVASAPQSHAEGYQTQAAGNSSHAEGNGTVASGNVSHAQNWGTVARGLAQTALGKWNVEDSAASRTSIGNFAVIVGRGTSAARADALRVAWGGNVHIYVDENAASGYTDYRLCQAIAALGWSNVWI